MSDTTNNMQDAVASGDEQALGNAVNAVLEKELSSEDQGALLVSMAASYMDAMSDENEEQIATLTEAGARLSALDTLEQEVQDEDKLGDVRKNLGLG